MAMVGSQITPVDEGEYDDKRLEEKATELV
jgi:hypothetical protein